MKRSRPRQGTVRTSTRSRAMRIIDSRLCMMVAAATLVAGAAFAQAPSPAPNETIPGAKPLAPGENLSKKLNQSNGVIHPKEVDPGIQKPAPKTGDPNVVPPPGASGGAPRRSRNERRLLRFPRLTSDRHRLFIIPADVSSSGDAGPLRPVRSGGSFFRLAPRKRLKSLAAPIRHFAVSFDLKGLSPVSCRCVCPRLLPAGRVQPA